MLLAFKAEPAMLLDIFLKDFENPPGTIASIVHLWLYGSVRMVKHEDIYLIKTNGMLELIAYYVLMSVAGAFIIGMLLNVFIIFYVMLPFGFLSLFFISSHYHTMNLIGLLKRSGYKGRVRMIDFIQARMLWNHAKRSFEST